MAGEREKALTEALEEALAIAESWASRPPDLWSEAMAELAPLRSALALPPDPAPGPDLPWSCPACEDLCWAQISGRNVRVGLHSWCPTHLALVRPAAPGPDRYAEGWRACREAGAREADVVAERWRKWAEHASVEERISGKAAGRVRDAEMLAARIRALPVPEPAPAAPPAPPKAPAMASILVDSGAETSTAAMRRAAPPAAAPEPPITEEQIRAALEEGRKHAAAWEPALRSVFPGDDTAYHAPSPPSAPPPSPPVGGAATLQPTLPTPAIGCRECEAEHEVRGNLRIPECHHGHARRDHQTTPTDLVAPSPPVESGAAACPRCFGGKQLTIFRAGEADVHVTCPACGGTGRAPAGGAPAGGSAKP